MSRKEGRKEESKVERREGGRKGMKGGWKKALWDFAGASKSEEALSENHVLRNLRLPAFLHLWRGFWEARRAPKGGRESRTGLFDHKQKASKKNQK